MTSRTRILWAAWAVTLAAGGLGAGLANSHQTLPPAPDVEARIVAGVTDLDVAALRAGQPDFAVVKFSDFDTADTLATLSPPGEDLPDEATQQGDWHIATLGSGTVQAPPRIQQARVRVRSDKEMTPCRKSGDKHVCGDASWQWVGNTKVRIGGREHTCIWAHPIDDRTLEIEYRGVLGGPWTLRTALADAAVGTGTPVDVSVTLGSNEFQHLHPDRRGFTTLSLPRVEEPSTLVVSIRADNVGRRHFCFEVTE